MAIVKCKECGKEISNNAAACPGCGANLPKKTKPLVWAVLAVVGMLVILAATRQSDPVKSATPNTPRPPDKQALQVALAREGANEIRKAMRDPDSLTFEFIGVNDTASVACFKYRSKNGYGGMANGALTIVNRKTMVRPEEYAKHCIPPLHDWTSAGN